MTQQTIMTGVGMVLLILGPMVGCRNKENKYVGTYVEEDRPGPPGIRGFRTVLELSRDGMYKFQTGDNSTTIGEWMVVKSGEQEDIQFTPSPSPVGISLRQTKKRGYCFVLPSLGGEIILAKQAGGKSVSMESPKLPAMERAAPSPTEDSVERAARIGSEPVDTDGQSATALPGLQNKDGVSAMDLAKRRLAVIENALKSLEFDCGRLPDESEGGLDALITSPHGLEGKWNGPYLKKSQLLDPWGNPYIYTSKGKYNVGSFDLLSYGADGRKGGDGENADIVND